MSKKMVCEKRHAPSLEIADIQGSPEDIAELFREEQLRVAKLFKVADPASIKFESEYYGHDGGLEMFVCWSREETDAEYQDRLYKEAAQARKEDKAKAKRRAQYEKLKAEFGE